MGELVSHKVVTSVKMQQIDGNSKSRVGKRRSAAAQKWGKITLGEGSCRRSLMMATVLAEF